MTAPATLPLSVSELKNALRIDSSVTADDALLTDYINAATSILERTFGLALISQTWKLWLDKWPMHKDWLPQANGYQTASFSLSEVKALDPAVSLLMHPVQSITHIKIYDSASTATTVDSTTYFIDSSQKPSRAVLNANAFSWPTTDLRPAKAIEIQFEVGFTTLPSELKMGILSMAISLYDSRGCSTAIPPGVYASFSVYAGARI